MIPEKRQSVTFGDKNTWDDWKLIPSIRPVFKPPTQKTNYIDIPGGNGMLDLSESLTGYPVFNNREGEIQFMVMNGYVYWAERYSEIMNYLHGQRMKAILYEEPDWFYEGRFSVVSWESGQTWSLVTIGYNVGPYKWALLKSKDPWEWNPFNFETGVIWDDLIPDYEINSPATWVSQPPLEGPWFGYAPISPVFEVSNSTNLEVMFKNEYLQIEKTVMLKDGSNSIPDFIFYRASQYTLEFKGVGNVSLDFRVGRL